MSGSYFIYNLFICNLSESLNTILRTNVTIICKHDTVEWGPYYWFRHNLEKRRWHWLRQFTGEICRVSKQTPVKSDNSEEVRSESTNLFHWSLTGYYTVRNFYVFIENKGLSKPFDGVEYKPVYVINSSEAFFVTNLRLTTIINKIRIT